MEYSTKEADLICKSEKKDSSELFKWQRAIPRADRQLQSINVVCELHFTENDIIRNFETKLPDGTVDKIPRGKPLLRAGAVPCLFPNLPSYLSKVPKARKPPSVRTTLMSSIVEANSTRGSMCTENPSREEIEMDIQTAEEEMKITREASEEVTMETQIFVDLKTHLNTILTPSPSWTPCYVTGLNEVLFTEWKEDYTCPKKVIIKSDMSFTVLLGSTRIEMETDNKIKSINEIPPLLSKIHRYRLCEGANLKSSPTCTGSLPNRNPGQRGALVNKCLPCRLSEREQNKQKKKPLIIRRHTKTKGLLKSVKMKNKRLKQKVILHTEEPNTPYERTNPVFHTKHYFSEENNFFFHQQVIKLRREIDICKNKCANVSQEALERAIGTLPSAQQESVRMCFAAAKLKDPRGRRYTVAWIYECLMLRIKSRASYEHIRNKQLLPLPSIDTLNKYMKKMSGMYGFSRSIFAVLKKKAQFMPEEERRGTLLIDEMKLTEAVHFDRNTMQINGFTDLGKHTPLHQTNKRGDHALVMMYHPFRGSWVQAIACFLSKGCASSTVLHQLIIECIILLEKSHFFVDVVTTDGASWNRTMWKKFGISEDNVGCEHICDSSRRLWFCSDFPHLIKNFRNFIVSKCETWTPEGVVKLTHWDSVVEMEDAKSFKLKISPRLCHDDIHPKSYQKMNVGRAYRFFGDKTAAAMEIYKEGHSGLKDCDSSIKLIKRIEQIIRIMSSRTPIDNPLKKGSSDAQYLEDFVTYLDKWAMSANTNNYYFLSSSTYVGLKVTLKATLELLSFLTDVCGYQYLMTSKLNQDSLERFFGMIRGACGSNDHPDSRVFCQIFRLMSTYSLVKPPKGSNVNGAELLSTLVNVKDLTDDGKDISELKVKLDLLLDNDTLDVAVDSDHIYHLQESSEVVLAYVSGYVARKSKRFSKCKQCVASLKSSDPIAGRNKLITLLSRGYLIYPSSILYELIAAVEKVVVGVLASSPINHNTFFEIASKVGETRLPTIGCNDQEHGRYFTEAIVRFFLSTRMFFICKSANIIENASNEKAKKLRKEARLT